MIKSTVVHLIEQFLGNSPKITSQLFFESLIVNGSGGAGCLFYGTTLQVSFWNIETNYRKFFLFCTSSTKLLTEITYLQSRKYIVIAKIEHDSFEKFVKKNTICNFDFKMRATF